MTSESPFDPVSASRRVMRLAKTGALGTLSENGHPFTSFVTVATTPEGEPILLLSRLAVHTKNLERDGRASLLMVAPGGEGGDPLAGARVTLSGAIGLAEDRDAAASRFLARHPEATGYAGFADFAFYRLKVEKGHLVAGFGRIHEIPASDLLVPGDLADLSEMEKGAVEHMNDDHADAIELYARHYLGEAAGPWRLTGLDALGMDLVCGERVARLDFPEPLRRASDLRPVLVAMSKEARIEAALENS